MENEQTSYLKGEILRLNKIISILIDQNDALSGKIANLERVIAGSATNQPYDKMTNIAGNAISSYVQNVIGADKLVYPYDKMEKGPDKFERSYDQMEKGPNSINNPYVKNDT